MTEFDKRCPGCRRPYDEANFKFDDVDPLSLPSKSKGASAGDGGAPHHNHNHSSNPAGSGASATATTLHTKKNAAGAGVSTHRQTGAAGAGAAATGGGAQKAQSSKSSAATVNRANLKALANARVVQKNLVYIIGIAPSIAQKELLVSWPYFGQYGKIEKATVKRAMTNTGTELASSAYITFSREVDAHAAIVAVDGYLFKGHTIKACLGTTKYCNMFLRNMKCSNPECSYLHEISDMTEVQARDYVVKLKERGIFTPHPNERKGVESVLPPRGYVGGRSPPVRERKPQAPPPKMEESSSWPVPGAAPSVSSIASRVKQKPPAQQVQVQAQASTVAGEEKGNVESRVVSNDPLILLKSLAGVEKSEYLRRNPRKDGQPTNFGAIGSERTGGGVKGQATLGGAAVAQPRSNINPVHQQAELQTSAQLQQQQAKKQFTHQRGGRGYHQNHHYNRGGRKFGGNASNNGNGVTSRR